ncbi:MAG: FecR family protein [Beijerinckiaceae bacterium]
MALSFPGIAQAQAVIGDAARVVNDVTGAIGSRRVALSTGSAVHQNETISTGASASAQLRFLDDTNLDVQPGSHVKLDRYVYNRDGSARGAVVSMTRGAFRFATGQSDPRAFKLQTPQAIIGIRGTVLDIDIERGVTHVTLRQGGIDVCPRSSRRNCAVLTQPGQSVSVTSTRVIDDDQIPGAIPPSGPGPLPPDIFIPGGGGPFFGIPPGRFNPGGRPHFPSGGGRGFGGGKGGRG